MARVVSTHRRRKPARQRAVPMSARARKRIYIVAAVLFAVIAVGALALAPTQTAEVPRTDDVKSDVELRFVFAFPAADAPQLERPVGVVADGDRVYVVDSAAGLVRVYDDRGVERSVVGEGTLDVPVYAAVDADRGVLYVTDRAKRALFLFGLDDGALVGTLAPVAAEGSTIATAWAPLALDVTQSGALVVSDVLARHRVLLLEPNGQIIQEIGGARAAEEATGVALALDFPNAVRATTDEVWVADSNNKRALVFGRDAVFRRVVPTGGLVRGFDFVPPVAGSAEATLVAFVDTLGGGIFLMDMAGTSLGRFGGSGSAEGLLAFPNDVSVDAKRGRLYVADTGNRRVQVWDVVPASAGDAAIPLFGGVPGRTLSRWIALAAALLAGLMAYRAYRAHAAMRPSDGTAAAWVESE